VIYKTILRVQENTLDPTRIIKIPSTTNRSPWLAAEHPGTIVRTVIAPPIAPVSATAIAREMLSPAQVTMPVSIVPTVVVVTAIPVELE
jgi:hypothetical protein